MFNPIRHIQQTIPHHQSRRTTQIKLALLAVIAVIHAAIQAYLIVYFPPSYINSIASHVCLSVAMYLVRYVWRLGNKQTETKMEIEKVMKVSE